MERQSNAGIGVEKSDLGSRRPDDAAMEGGRGMGDSSQQSGGQAKQKAAEVADQARELGSRVERAAMSQAERSRHQVADGVHAIGEALRVGAAQVRQQDNAFPAQFVERLAEPVDRLSDYLERHDAREIAHDLESFARRNEGLFLSGAFAVGMLGARFLKASSTEMQIARDEGMDLRQQTSRVREPERDAVGRPQAPGYESPSRRNVTGEGPDTSGSRPL